MIDKQNFFSQVVRDNNIAFEKLQQVKEIIKQLVVNNKHFMLIQKQYNKLILLGI